MTIVALIALALLGAAALIVLLRLFRGPTNLDRIVASEILMVIVIAGVATESAWQRTATNLPLLLILGLVGFVGGVAVTRFMSRDADDLDVEQTPARPVHPTAPVDESTDPTRQSDDPTDDPTDEPTERKSHR
ncbi:monovalent cation/H+ antiporter complex subunit F [Humibacillus xanthopallidus]|uniref:Multicomponent Na+:H+ antiporter subunit F n=1 Tax=Humibacillus xanthopallidus TaxID=412689 RepID=A0A543I0G6_9MICO|nr:monovalent cation/H+ antiporter complex subunit F [Humibacillus xanthopallidus]TQM64087.1 multicomponent Na+:H+ antiporter subunit F [Humibacillus xanthopallidus]